MKIAFFTDTYKPQINGVVSSIELYLKELKKRGHEVHIFCPLVDGCKLQENVHAIDSLEFPNYPGYRVAMPSFEIMREIKKIRPDIIHIHSPASVGMIGTAISKIFRIPTIMTYHTLLDMYSTYIFGKVIGNKEENLIKNYTQCFYRKASLITVPSRSIKKLLRGCGIKKQIEVLPSPIDIEEFKVSKGKNKKPVILHVGRLCKEKRIDMVLECFKELLKKINAKLIITSGGPDKKRLKKLVKDMGIDKNVVFTGYLPKDQLAKIYSSADVFVSASDTETQGLVLLEAMASGCPVVVRNALGFKDVVRNGYNGFLFKDKDDFVEKIYEVLTKKRLKKRLIKNGYKTAQKFDINNYFRKIEKIYEKVMRKNIKSPRQFLYAGSLLLGLTEAWLFRKIRLPINKRFIYINSKFVKMSLKLDKIFF